MLSIAGLSGRLQPTRLRQPNYDSNHNFRQKLRGVTRPEHNSHILADSTTGCIINRHEIPILIAVIIVIIITTTTTTKPKQNIINAISNSPKLLVDRHTGSH
jgi:hypothetical protein